MSITGTKTGELRIPEMIGGLNVVEIGERAFSDCSGLTGELTIPSCVRVIGEKAFLGCRNLTDIIIPESVEKIESNAFAVVTWGTESEHFPQPIKITVYSKDVEIAQNAFGMQKILYGYSGSSVEQYAAMNNCAFGLIDEPSQISEYRVTNATELINAIGSYRRIILADGVYKIVEEDYSGGIILSGIVSLSIEAENPGKAEILCEPGKDNNGNNASGCFDPVITITTCENIKIDGLILGHDGGIGGCNQEAYVVGVTNASNIIINNCDLYGCGSVGVNCRKVNGVNIHNSVVRDCQLHIASGSSNSFSDGSDIKSFCFNGCIMSGHIGHTHGNYYYSALNCPNELYLTDCVLLNNNNPTFDNHSAVITNCKFYNNVWDGGTPQPSGICLNGITWQLDGTVLKLGFPLELDKGTIESKTGKVMDYSSSAAPWKNCEFTEVQYAEGIEKPDKAITSGGSDPADPVKSIKLDKNTLTLVVGETAMLKAEIIPDNATASITWASNLSVAKVENGLVTALSEGECTITASAGGKSASCDVVVTANHSGEEPTNRDVHISGIKPKSKIYDGKPFSYAGTAVLLDTSGNQIQGVTLAHSYSGTLSDGSVYAEAEEAPSQAGSYTLTFKISGDGAAGYNLNRAAYSFDIIRKAVTITAESVKIEVGERLPETADLRYTIDGLIENDTLPQNPSLKYSADNISTDKEGKYEIVPYGADGGNNYKINYVNGILLVGNYGEIPVEDIPNGGIIPEGLWVAGIAEDGYDYTGKAVKPQVRVYDYKTPLREKQDYTIAYARNTRTYNYDSSDKEFDAKKAPTITVTVKGNYSGKETLSFKIRPLDIGGEGFSADNMAVAYKKNVVQKPIPELSWNGKKLRNKVDYTVAYYDSKDNELDAVKEVGEYYIVLTGRENFSGALGINLTVTDRLKLMNKVSVAGLKGQPYTGDAIMPVLTVKDGRTKLTEDVHYVVSYRNNTEVGTAYAVVTGIAEAGYCGTKRVSFKIMGTPIRNASVTGLTGQKFVYEGVDMTPQLQLGIRSNKDGAEKPLVMGTDYTVTWQKNRNAGTATVIFTGKGAYTGTLKKTFKIGKFDIAANADSRFVAALEQETIPYAKGGAKPKVSVKFKNSDGSWQILTEGQDYTLSYRNHTAVNDGSRADKQPTVIVKGKGNFSGIYGAALNYRINPQELGQLSITAQDKTYQNRKNIYATKVTVTDLNGKILRAGTDYDKALIYTYEGETVVTDTVDDRVVTRAAGELVGKNDMIPAGTKLNVRIVAKAGSNYTGSLVGEYRITQAAISTASVSILKQTYTGQPIILDKSQITVRIKGTVVEEDQYEIVQGSYKNNVKKGNASVTIRGVGNYGGTKNVKFAIKAKGFVWWK